MKNQITAPSNTSTRADKKADRLLYNSFFIKAAYLSTHDEKVTWAGKVKWIGLSCCYFHFWWMDTCFLVMSSTVIPVPKAFNRSKGMIFGTQPNGEIEGALTQHHFHKPMLPLRGYWNVTARQSSRWLTTWEANIRINLNLKKVFSNSWLTPHKGGSVQCPLVR